MRKLRVILCDDENMVLDVFRHLFERMGYEVLTADTPITCAFYREHANTCPQHDRCTDILITDHNMPNMTGLELLEMQHHRGCKLTSKNKALMTGNADSRLSEHAAVLGCQFFSKPVSISTIIAWVKDCEKRVDLSDPLASDLYLPAKKKSLYVASSLK